MMAQDVLICEILCFMRNNVDKTPPCQLKPVSVSFYKDDELIAGHLSYRVALRDIPVGCPAGLFG